MSDEENRGGDDEENTPRENGDEETVPEFEGQSLFADESDVKDAEPENGDGTNE